jgi:hypothetical protein
MGLFDLFGSKEEREKSALRRLVKKVTERYGPPENRQKAIEQLGDIGTPDALRALCQRFTIHAEPGITDGEEKERTRAILVEAGETAVEPLAEFVRVQESGIAWCLRALAEIWPAEKVTAFVLEELARLSREYTRDPEKKLVLLTWLVEHKDASPPGDVPGALLPLLEDFSDDVRIAGVRALAALAPGESVREGLIELLLRDRDNARVRGDVLDALARIGADVKGYRPTVETLLVEPFYLDREGRVKKRG